MSGCLISRVVYVWQLRVREHPVVGPYVEGLSSYVIESLEDIKVCLITSKITRLRVCTSRVFVTD